MTSTVSDKQRKLHFKIQTDLAFFCAKCLFIKTKEGDMIPFVWNRAQKYLHKRIEEQIKKIGMVRMFILKGRQQGISTYIAARLYRNTTRNKHRSTFILSHHSSTTGSLFGMVDRYQQHCPDIIQIKALVSNNRQMKFENGSQYTVGTAGTGSIGRGDTHQYLHNSEVAYFENTGDLATGIMQTVADVPGTEVYNESTANGIGGYFYAGCMDALKGDDLFEIVFIPWYWQDEYSSPLRSSFKLTADEARLKDNYEITDEQLQWRRNKIAFFKKSGFGESKFKQEYPFTVEEAFQSSGDSLINPEKVTEARKSKIKNTTAPLVMGVDPARTSDRFVITYRRGNHLIKHEVWRGGIDPMEAVGKLASRFKKHPDLVKCFIDNAEGAGIVSRLKELGWGDIVVGASFANSPDEDGVYTNKRAEMAGRMRDWFDDEAGCRIPDDDEIAVDLASIPDFETKNSRGLLQLVPKDKIKKDLGFSPDIFDAFALTFFQFVRADHNRRGFTKVSSGRKSEMRAVNRRRGKPRAQDYDDFDDPRGMIRQGSNIQRRR